MQIIALIIGLLTLVESVPHYWEALEKAIHFYEAQRVGFLPLVRSNCWRFHAFLNDKGDNCEDLTGGWMEATGYVKFNYPMSAAVTMLAYGGIYYRDIYKESGLFEKLLETIKWPLDYFIKCYINEKLVYAQCGTGDDDRIDMSSPEDTPLNRKCYAVTDSNPGTDVAASMAAALAAGHLLFRDYNPKYADVLLNTAEMMFSFAVNYKGYHFVNIPDSSNPYKSSNGYFDELAEAAALLFKSTQNLNYSLMAEGFYNEGNFSNIWGQNWDCRTLAVNYLLYEITKKPKYIELLNEYYTSNIEINFKLEGKLIYKQHLDVLEIAANDAFFAFLLYDNYGSDTSLSVSGGLVKYATNNIDFILGSNSNGISYLIGYGNYLKLYNHKASGCPQVPKVCYWDYFLNDNNPNTELTGALVGGPDEMGNFQESKGDELYSKISSAYNSGLTGGLVRLFGTHQTVADVQTISRTCKSGPDFFIGKSASNYQTFKSWLEGIVQSPFEGCDSTTNIIFNLNQKKIFLNVAPAPPEELYEDLINNCDKEFTFNQNTQKCEKLECSENCLNCALDDFKNNNCFKCSENFELFQNECISSDCFSDFCQTCVTEITNDCSVCFACKNLKFTQESEFFVKCSQIITNCQNCIYNNQNLICASCEPSYSWSEEQQTCVEVDKIIIQNFEYEIFEGNLLNRSCLNGFHYDLNLNECFEISHLCAVGCLECVLTLDKCLVCDHNFFMINNRCELNPPPPIIVDQDNLEEHKNLLDYLTYPQKNCTKITNNITFINYQNVTVFLNEKEFSVGRDVEIKDFFLDCNKDKSICEKIKNVTDSQTNDCTNYNTENYEIIIKNYNNITINYYGLCSPSRNYSRIDENIVCEDAECFNYKKTIEYENNNSINRCEEYYIAQERLLYENDKNIDNEQNDEIDKCLFCQIKKDFYCEKRNECLRECIFEKINNYEYVNSLKDTIVDFDLNILKGKLPDYVNVDFDLTQQKLVFRFLKNYPDFKFRINSNMVKNAVKCRIKSPIQFYIKNDNYSVRLQKISNQKPSISPVAAIVSGVFFLGFASFTPSGLYQIIQFNDLFNYLSILQISGGSFFNTVNNFSESQTDIDYFLLDSKKEYEYKMKLKEINSLFIVSMVDFFFLFMIFFILGGKIYLRITRHSRYEKLKNLFKKKTEILKDLNRAGKLKKLWIKLKLFYQTFDSDAFIHKVENYLFIQYICRIPLFVHIFTLKYLFLKKSLFIVYYLILFIYSLFLYYFVSKIIYYLKNPLDEDNTEFQLINNEEKNYQIVFNDFCKTGLRYFLVLSIILFKSFSPVAFAFVIVFIVLMIAQILFSLKRGNPFYNVIFFVLSYVFFLLWIVSIIVEKYSSLNMEIASNLFYVASNILMFVANIVEYCYKRSLIKKFVKIT